METLFLRMSFKEDNKNEFLGKKIYKNYFKVFSIVPIDDLKCLVIKA